MATATATTNIDKARSLGAQRAQVSQLTTYEWVALDKRGKRMKGDMPAKNATLVKAELRRQGMNPQTVRERAKPLFGSTGSTIKPGDVAIFSRQIATMMASGVPMIQAFDIIADGQKNIRFKNVLIDVKQNIEGGSSLNEALGRYPVQFDELYCNLVKAGEASGVLDTVLDTVATYKERTEAIKKKIKKALFYPAMVLVVVFMVCLIMLLFVVPVFAKTFKDAGAQLPAPTQLLVTASEFMQSYWFVVIGIIGGSIAAIVIAKKRSVKFAHFLDRMSLKMPVMGNIVRNSAIARFARTLGVTFRAGVPLVEALDAVAGATGSVVYGDAVRQMREDIAVGHQLQLAMRQTGLFPNMVVQMTAIGEESGALDNMLFKVAEFYEEEVSNAVDTLSTLLEPIIMVVLGTLVGGMVVALYLPIFKLAGTF
ncbi:MULTISPECIES: type II secretion system F family protein [unclassified Rhodanobacter]|uniref:type II secretion system F family protein n=1 Tax=unclassified Rhodanobacter TaxID=2621553 RepID=UPI0007AA02A3|nr:MULTISPECIES: type II secretion system F family protein [unclassified Rhodanobacter]KZC15298.1 type II secretory pathway protein [Rhodanobacter sp. FW104-R8]KZC27761.1 type II secretory pathway protein [Rhodanobacter sp. FW510-T8]KZC29475.1 type II secretory pathway protein [Rhodanobacter sp. FW510-R10]